MIVRSFTKTYGLNTTISISSNNYGENQILKKFIPKSRISILNDKPVKLYGDGKNIRDWLHVKDNCCAIDLIFNNGKIGEKYNIAAENELTNIQVLNIIFNALKKTSSINYVKDRLGHDFRYSLDIAKIKNQLNWTPKFILKIQLII